jgi:hypothetical protein
MTPRFAVGDWVRVAFDGKHRDALGRIKEVDDEEGDTQWYIVDLNSPGGGYWYTEYDLRAHVPTEEELAGWLVQAISR